jgi:hypothetical protein
MYVCICVCITCVCTYVYMYGWMYAIGDGSDDWVYYPGIQLWGGLGVVWMYLRKFMYLCICIFLRLYVTYVRMYVHMPWGFPRIRCTTSLESNYHERYFFLRRFIYVCIY